MAVRIINLGVLPQEKVYRGQCTHCQTVIECKRSDLRSTVDQRDFDQYVECPVCKSMIWPRPVRHKAKAGGRQAGPKLS